MAWQRGEPAPAQINPAELDEDDWWTRACWLCPMVTQGGGGGLGTHMATVHPEARP